MKKMEYRQNLSKKGPIRAQPYWRAAGVMRTACCWLCAGTNSNWSLSVLHKKVQKRNYKPTTDQRCFLTSLHQDRIAGHPKSSLLVSPRWSGTTHIHWHPSKQGQAVAVTRSFSLQQLEQERHKAHSATSPQGPAWQELSEQRPESIRSFQHK